MRVEENPNPAGPSLCTSPKHRVLHQNRFLLTNFTLTSANRLSTGQELIPCLIHLITGWIKAFFSFFPPHFPRLQNPDPGTARFLGEATFHSSRD